MVQGVIGLAIAAFGLAFVPMLMQNWADEGLRGARFAIWTALVLPIGLWVLYDATRRGWLLELTGPRGVDRVAFEGSVDEIEATTFARVAAELLGCS